MENPFFQAVKRLLRIPLHSIEYLQLSVRLRNLEKVYETEFIAIHDNFMKLSNRIKPEIYAKKPKVAEISENFKKTGILSSKRGRNN